MARETSSVRGSTSPFSAGRRARRSAAAVTFMVVGALAGCGPGDDEGMGAPADTVAPETTVVGETSSDDVLAAERDCAERAADAQLTFQPEKSMVVGQPELVQAVATVGGAPTPSSLPGGEQVATVGASLECRVEATLEGLGFDISPAGWQQKSFLRSNAVTFTWTVEAQERGSSIPLTLRVRAFVDLPGSDDAIPIGPDDVTVDISVSSQDKDFGDRWNEFWTNPFWASIGALVALVTTVGSWALWIRRRAKGGRSAG